MFSLGDVVRLTQAVSYRDGGAGSTMAIDLPAGISGRVTDVGDTHNPCIIVRFDAPCACLVEWDNSATFDNHADDDGCQGIAVASDVLERIF